MRNDRADLRWAPRVSLLKIRALYLSDAQGIRDEGLLDDVGTGLYARCQSILEFAEAVQGRVKCPRCARSGGATVIERITRQQREVLRCTECSWQMQWRVYLSEAMKTTGQLVAGHARAAFEQFVDMYPRCRAANERILAVDTLLHEFHWFLRNGDPPQAARTACVNLLQGST